MEDAVAKVVAPPRAARATSDGARAPHAAVIKQVRHRAHLERRMDQVVDLVSRMAEVVGTTGDDQDLVNMEADIQQLLASALGARMAEAIRGIASRMEDAVAKVVSPSRAARATPEGAWVPHAAAIK